MKMFCSTFQIFRWEFCSISVAVKWCPDSGISSHVVVWCEQIRSYFQWRKLCMQIGNNKWIATVLESCCVDLRYSIAKTKNAFEHAEHTDNRCTNWRFASIMLRRRFRHFYCTVVAKGLAVLLSSMQSYESAHGIYYDGLAVFFSSRTIWIILVRKWKNVLKPFKTVTAATWSSKALPLALISPRCFGVPQAGSCIHYQM